MSANLKRLMLIMVSASLIPTIWGTGWYLYGELAIWETLTNIQYQNILLILTGIQSFLFYAGAYKITQPLSDFDKQTLKKMVKIVFNKTEKILTQHDTKIEQLYQDVADLKVAFEMKPPDKQAEVTPQ